MLQVSIGEPLGRPPIAVAAAPAGRIGNFKPHPIRAAATALIGVGGGLPGGFFRAPAAAPESAKS
jgi:hypothetical protein